MSKKLTAMLALTSFCFMQTGCYSSYFIDKTELEKLESRVEPQEVVVVYGDCPAGTVSSLDELGPLYAQNDAPKEGGEAGTVDDDVMSEIEGITGEGETATDASDTPDGEAGDKTPKAKKGAKAATSSSSSSAPRPGCTEVSVSASNSLQLVTNEGRERVTPFNFIMSGGQLVSPEYDLLLQLEQVEGARVREFSTFKTVATIVLVSAAAVGTFVGISLLAPDSSGFQP